MPKNVLSVAAILGSVATFWLGREAVEKFTGARVEKVDRLLRRRGLAPMIGVRLVPVLPFTAINYAAGLTSIAGGTTS
ncbi:VTT domain-containing protein [Micrococcaceae bacterium Sec5.7]